MRQMSFEDLSEKDIEGPYKLPEGWKWARLGDVVEPIMGQSPPSSTYNQEGIGLPFYQGKIDFGELYPTPRVWCNKPNKIAEPNDILISVRAPVGPVNICKEKSCIGRGLAALRPSNNDTIFYLFLFYYLKSVEKNWTDTGKGSTFQAIRKRDLQRLPIPLPPLPEQKRIVARIEELFNKIDKIRKLRKEALEQVKALMSAALHEIFSKADEKGWRWVRLGDVAEEIYRYPSFYGFKHLDEGVPVIRGEHIDEDGNLSLNNSEYWYISQEESLKFPRTILKEGDLIITVRGTIGKVAVVRKEQNHWQISPNLIRVSPRKELIDPYYFFLSLKYLFSKKFPRTKTSVISTLNAKDLKQFPIPLPPLPEQKRIVAYLDSIQKKVVALQKFQEETEKEVEELRESILYKAFRGKL